jgi:hypothetical protein
MDGHRILFDALDWQSPAPGLRVKVWRQGNKQLRLLEHSQEFVEPDWCEKAHYGLVLEGELEISFHNGSQVRFPPGSGVYISAGEKHKGHPVGARVLIFLVEDV